MENCSFHYVIERLSGGRLCYYAGIQPVYFKDEMVKSPWVFTIEKAKHFATPEAAYTFIIQELEGQHYYYVKTVFFKQ
jgi:hypothetical protein